MAALTSAILTGVGAGISFFGQRQAAKQAEAAGEYNARIAEDEARVKELENHENVKRQRAEKRRAMAQAKAKMASNGAVLGEGSTLDFMEVLDNRLETQVQDSARSAQLEARALRQQANLSRYQGQQKSSALKMQSFGTLLSGTSATAAKYHKAKFKTKQS